MTGWARSVLVAWLVWLASPGHAQPNQLVVIVRPGEAGAALRSAAAHLEGELRLHAFVPIVIDGAPLADVELEAIAREQQAIAAVALAESREVALAHVWSRRGDQPPVLLTLSAALDGEGPSALAVRVVD